MCAGVSAMVQLHRLVRAAGANTRSAVRPRAASPLAAAAHATVERLKKRTRMACVVLVPSLPCDVWPCPARIGIKTLMATSGSVLIR